MTLLCGLQIAWASKFSGYSIERYAQREYVCLFIFIGLNLFLNRLNLLFQRLLYDPLMYISKVNKKWLGENKLVHKLHCVRNFGIIKLGDFKDLLTIDHRIMHIYPKSTNDQ